ncbi:hypothetical protein SAMN05444008_104157 [Cnuella takakiae]|uniref:Uncharacterized protein n=1 Tax=Cnuella takakiae TaxID=1302690 RepID=A0A1M4Y4U5_9BACT|nr:hypothetical protein [Cnuella takakiae]SHF00834.1 hypothetical protein SAMN05444008_104157 [Cnuella takakiae]
MPKFNILNTLGPTLLCLTSLIFAAPANAQLKVGDNPTSIHKSSILELESNRQGLLLPRLSDTAAINTLTPPNGMLIYLTSDNSLRIRSAGAWKKLANMTEASANWSLVGNEGTDPATQFLGTKDNQPLTIKTNNTTRMVVNANGNVGIGTASPSATLNVDGTVKLENLAAGTTEQEVLVIDANGSVLRRSLPSSAFENAIKAINSIQTQSISLTAAASTTYNTVTVTNTAADSTIAIYLPVQDGQNQSNKPYGLLTYADWQKIESAVQDVQAGAVASQSNANGISITTNGTTRTIQLHPADATNAGVVTTSAQTLAGTKTFQDGIILNNPLTLYNTNSNTSADSVLVINNGVVETRKVSAAAFGDAIRSINGNTEAAQTLAFGTTGTDLNIATAGGNTINLNVPSASASARGVVTTATQTFAGEKTFQDNFAAAAKAMVGSTGAANSTIQVAGSMALAIRTITADATAADSDNTILANTSSGPITLTLPAATNMTGRIYSIKKIGNGGIDNALTITPTGATIDGGNNLIIYNDWTFVTLQTDGTNWYIIKK